MLFKKSKRVKINHDYTVQLYLQGLPEQRGMSAACKCDQKRDMIYPWILREEADLWDVGSSTLPALGLQIIHTSIKSGIENAKWK